MSGYHVPWIRVLFGRAAAKKGNQPNVASCLLIEPFLLLSCHEILSCSSTLEAKKPCSYLVVILGCGFWLNMGVTKGVVFLCVCVCGACACMRVYACVCACVCMYKW